MVSGLGAQLRRRPAFVVVAVVLVGLYLARQDGDAIAAGVAVTVPGHEFADPFLLTVGGVTFAYGTNSADGGNVPMLATTDRRRWSPLPDALPRLPGWAEAGAFSTWAPAVALFGSQYVLYYATRVAGAGMQCISAAVAAAPVGPFTDASAAPLVCQHADGGSIDPSPYRDGSGVAYLTWKSEGTRPGTTPAVWAQRLSTDGRSLVGEPTMLLRPGLGWHRGVVEGPAMLVAAGTFTLLYSAADWKTGDYAIGTAACDGPLGPCTAAPEPLLATGVVGAGPGGAEPFMDGDGRWWLAFHSWTHEPGSPVPASRQLVVTRLRSVPEVALEITTVVSGKVEPPVPIPQPGGAA